MKVIELLKEANMDDFGGIDDAVIQLRHAYIDMMAKKLAAHPNIKSLKVTKAPYLNDSFKGTEFQFTYKGHPVHAEMSHSGHSIMTKEKSKDHLNTVTQLRSMKGLTTHLDKALKARGW